MYFIIVGGESVHTSKIGHSDTVALRHMQQNIQEKGMKSRHKVWQWWPISDFNHSCLRDYNSSIKLGVYLCFGDKYMYYYVELCEIKNGPKHPIFQLY